jgi:hypothetical protein
LGASCGRQSSEDGKVHRLSSRLEFRMPGGVKVSLQATSSSAGGKSIKKKLRVTR